MDSADSKMFIGTRIGRVLRLISSHLAVACTIVLGAGCSGDRRSDLPIQTVEVSDSPGIRIVENLGDTDDEPLRVTWNETWPEQRTAGPLFRTEGRVVLRDGSDFVLDAGNHRLVYASKVPPQVVGRRGEGPAEFSLPGSISRTGDGDLLVWDRGLSRLTQFRLNDSDALELVRTQSVDFSLPGMSIRQIFSASGGYYGILDKNADVLNPPDPGAKPTGVLVSLDLEGNLLDTLTTFPQGGPVVIRSSAEGSFGLSAFSPPFEARPWASHIADCGGRFAISSGGREMKVEVWDLESSRRWLIENEFVGRLVTDVDRERYFSQFGTAVRQRYDVETQIEIPERHPAIGFVRLTKDGYLWVKAGVASTSLGEVMWRVWPITSESLGESFDVLLPANFTVQDSNRGIISGLHLDNLGREEIVTYTLSEPLPDNCPAVAGDR